MLNVTYQRRLEAGLCCYCGGSRDEGAAAQTCASCRERMRKERGALKAKSLCRDCRKPLAPEDPSRCSLCREKHNKYHSDHKARLKAENRCLHCSSPLVITSGKQPLCETCFFRKTAWGRLGSCKLWKILADVWARQRGICPYTGLLIRLGVDASLDHISPVSRFPKLRCDPMNLQWVHYRVNEMKKDWTHDEFLAFLRLIVPV